jgi:hypothetical protein
MTRRSGRIDRGIEMRKLLACLAAMALSACAVGNQHDYLSATPQLTAQGNGSIAVAVQDQRPYILDHDKSENFCGLYRGGFGVPFDITTLSKNPLAADFRRTIISALKSKGFAAEAVDTAPGLSEEDVKQALIAADKDRALLIIIKEWKSDTYLNTGLLYDLTATVLNRTGAVTAENNILAATRENLGPAALPRDARLAVARAYQARLETLLNDPKIVAALQE